MYVSCCHISLYQKLKLFFVFDLARRRVQRKKMKKLGKSTDTEEEDGELDDEGISVVYYCIHCITYFLSMSLFSVDKKKKKGKSGGEGGVVQRWRTTIYIFAHFYVCYEH